MQIERYFIASCNTIQ